MKLHRLALAAGLAVTMMGAAPAGAVVTGFGQINLVNNSRNVYWAKRGTTATTQDDGRLFTSTLNGQNYASAAQNVAVTWNFLFSPYDGSNPFSIPAWLKLDASTINGPASLTGSNFDQIIRTGYFEIRSQGSFTANNVAYGANTLILRGDFTNGTMSGRSGSRDLGFNASNTSPGVTLVYSSDVLDFTQVIDTGFSLSIGALSSAVGRANASSVLNSFRGTISGQFSSDPLPAVPEPASWALMITGMGMVGFAMRRRTRVVAA